MEHSSRRNEKFIIRQANAGDISFIRSLAERFARVGMPAWRDPAKMWQFHQRGGEEAGAAINDATSLVLLATSKDNTPLGFIYVTGERDFFTGEQQGYIADVAVSAEAERKGIGRGLMERAESWAKEQGYRLLTLDVFASNTHARSFYQKLGYAEETLKLVKEI